VVLIEMPAPHRDPRRLGEDGIGAPPRVPSGEAMRT
jgi:hypothetical protein